MNVLITGGTGFIGKNLARILTDRAIRYRVFNRRECDLRNEEQTFAFFRKLEKFDRIFHMAAIQGGGAPEFQKGMAAALVHDNVKIHANTMEAWRLYQPQAKFIFVGTSCAYPASMSLLHEPDFHNGPVDESVFYYANTKRMADVGLRAYRLQYNLKYVHVIYATPFGPNDYFGDPVRTHVMAALIVKFIKAKEHHEPQVEIWGDGTQIRELLYVDDQIDAMLLAAEHFENEIVNISNGIGYTIREVAEIIRDAVGYQGNLFFNKDRYTGVKYKVLDNKRFIAKTDWKPKYTLRQGIERTVAWYLLNRNNKVHP